MQYALKLSVVPDVSPPPNNGPHTSPGGMIANGRSRTPHVYATARGLGPPCALRDERRRFTPPLLESNFSEFFFGGGRLTSLKTP